MLFFRRFPPRCALLNLKMSMGDLITRKRIYGSDYYNIFKLLEFLVKVCLVKCWFGRLPQRSALLHLKMLKLKMPFGNLMARKESI